MCLSLAPLASTLLHSAHSTNYPFFIQLTLCPYVFLPHLLVIEVNAPPRFLNCSRLFLFLVLTTERHFHWVVKPGEIDSLMHKKLGLGIQEQPFLFPFGPLLFLN